jgi:hypothetical protein
MNAVKLGSIKCGEFFAWLRTERRTLLRGIHIILSKVKFALEQVTKAQRGGGVEV